MQVLETSDGSSTALDPDYQESFHSTGGARAEAEDLYLKLSGLEQRFRSGEQHTTHVLDIGLGLGLNALCAIESWSQHSAPGDLTIVSLEKNSTLIRSLQDGRSPWQQYWPLQWKAWTKNLDKLDTDHFEMSMIHPNTTASLRWMIRLGQAEQGLWHSSDPHHFDVFWQDAFSPKKNPELWTPSWFAKLASCSEKDSCLVTYSVARTVRDALNEAGWQWRKLPGSLSSKRHWLFASPVS